MDSVVPSGNGGRVGYVFAQDSQSWLPGTLASPERWTSFLSGGGGASEAGVAAHCAVP